MRARVEQFRRGRVHHAGFLLDFRSPSVAIGGMFLSAVFAFSISVARADEPAAPSHSTIDGGTIYQKLCAECHGHSGIPDADAAFLLPPPANLVEPPFVHGTNPLEIERVIREGLGVNMIGYQNRLSRAQIRAVAAYVIYLRSKGKTSPAIGELETVIAPPSEENASK